MKYNKILITGGAGFIGSHLVDYLVSKKIHVRVMDCLYPQIHKNGNLPDYLNKNIEFIKGDVTNREDWKQALRDVEAVIHLASAVGVGQSMYEVEHYVKTNSLGTALLLDILANEKHTVKKMLIAASMSSYGEGTYKCAKCNMVQQPQLRTNENLQKNIWEPLCFKCNHTLNAIPTDENARLNGPSIYAINKKNQEELMMAIGKAYRIPTVSLRFFNVYGSRQSLSNPYTGVTAIFFSRVKNSHSPLINEDGLQTRDFVHVSDVVHAIFLSLDSEKANYEILNVGSGKPVSIKKVAQVIIQYCKSNVHPEITGKFRVADVRHCFADISKIDKIIGWKPKITFEAGIKDIFEWAKNQTAHDAVEESIKELEKRGLR